MCGEQQTRPDGRHRVISLEKSSQQRQMPVAALSCYFCSLGQNNSWARPESWRAQCRWIVCSKSHIKQQSRCIGPAVLLSAILVLYFCGVPNHFARPSRLPCINEALARHILVTKPKEKT